MGAYQKHRKGAQSVRRVKEVYFISNNTPYNLKGFCEAIAAQILEEGAEQCETERKRMRAF